MAATANHPDGSFVAPAEPDEDIAAIAKQISDHAEVIYQTWKARGLAPNEILTCHNNINVVDKFGSVLTSAFSSSSSSPLPSPPVQSSVKKSPPSDTPMMDLLYNSNVTPVNANNLEQIVNKFVVEDKARLAVRQKNCDTPGALPTAKNYPSSIQYALQKFERKSPDVVLSPTKFTSRSPEKPHDVVSPTRLQYSCDGEKNPPEQFIPVTNAPQMVRPIDDSHDVGGDIGGGKGGSSGSVSKSSTWPVKTKSVSNVSSGCMPSTREVCNYRQNSLATLSSKIEKRGLTEDFLDEVAKEEERLINALKTGMVITSNENKLDASHNLNKNSPGKIHTQVLSEFEQLQNGGENSRCQLSNKQKNNKQHSNVAEKAENFSKKSDDISHTDGVCDVPKRRKRIGPVDIVNGDSFGAQLRPNLRTNTANNNLNNQPNNPVRPFLTRGSVAERVMMFEKCPTEIIEKRTKANNGTSPSWKNLASDVHIKIQNYSKEASQKKNAYPPHTTLQRHTKANKNIFIPRFYYPYGKPASPQKQSLMFKNIEETFQSLPNFHATKEQFSAVTKACGCPLYWKAALFIACGGEKLGFVEMSTFLEYWKDLTSVCHDDASRFMRIITRSTKRSYIIPEDLIPLVQDVVNTHPGLTFLKQAPEFHSRYVHTVICRVFYCVNQSWNGQISLAELRKSDFLRAIQLLEEEEDINQVTAYFSYEHFYVIYCKFWELDRDHDLYISKEDLARHSDHALSTRIIDRIFSRTRSKVRNSMVQEGKMSYTDFVIFLLAEEDKRHPRAIEYWFRCMDLDGDGFLSMYELEYFYDEQLQRMEAMGIECLPFEDCLCQMLDMIQPRIPGKISLGDLKRCKMTSIFFDTFFNLEKYLDHEQRDPFASQRDHDNDMTDWDRYAAEEYELLVAEESGNDHYEDVDQYKIADAGVKDNDFFSSNLDEILSGPQEYVNNSWFNHYIADDFVQPRMLVTDNYNKVCNNDSSDDDYAGDSDDCSL